MSTDKAQKEALSRALSALVQTEVWAFIDGELARLEEVALGKLVRGGLTHDQYARASGEATTGVADADVGAPGANEVMVNIGYA